MTQSRFDAFDLSRAGARHRGVATLAALLLGVAGCGGNGGGGSATRLSKAQYESRVRTDGKELKAVFKPLTTPPSSLPQFAASIKKGQAKLRTVAADLAGVKPPQDVAADNAKLVAGLRKLADQLEPLREGAAAVNVRKVQTAVAAIQSSHTLQGAEQATADMKKKGYRIGELGR